MNRLADVLDRPEPKMAVTFTEPLGALVLQNILGYADVAEFRADRYPSCEPDYLEAQAKRLASLPLLLTIRHAAEGGDWTGAEEERLQLFSELLPQVDGVDIELAANILPDVIEAAHEQDKVVVASSHDFSTTPSLEALEEALTKAQEAGADYTKFAASAKTPEDFQRLVAFTLKHAHDGLIVVAMDDYGPLSRIFLPAIGSHLTYAFPGEVPVARGQLSFSATHKLLKNLYPNP